MRARGVVRRLEGADAWVDVSAAEGCGRCHEEGGCGGISIAAPFGRGTRTLRVPNDIDARPGEPVGVVVSDALPVRAAMLTYGWPVLGVLGGAALGTMLSGEAPGDLPALIGAVAGGALLFWRGWVRSRVLMDRTLGLRLERGDALPAEGCGR